MLAGALVAPVLDPSVPLRRVSTPRASAHSEPLAPIPAKLAAGRAAALGHTIYLAGGFSGSGRGLIGPRYLSELYAYDVKANTWTTRTPLPPEQTPRLGRDLCAMVTAPTSRLLTVSNEHIGVYDPAGDAWSIATQIPTPRSAMEVAQADDGRIFTIGGRLTATEPAALVEAYDPQTNHWTSHARMPEERFWFATAMLHGIIYVFGGLTVDSRTDHWLPATTSLAYDIAADAWREVAPMPTTRRGPAAAVVNNTILVLGGGDGASPETQLATVDVYDPATDSWAAGAPLTVPRGFAAVARLADGSVYALGGITNAPDIGLTIDDVERFDPVTQTWVTTRAPS
jgi:N-acetylneuraminic acid mutarotase